MPAPEPAPAPEEEPAAPPQESLDPGRPKQRSVSPAPANLSPMEQIGVIMQELDKLTPKVEGYQGGKKDKDYLYMEEMMTRLLLKLDNIEAEGKDEVRQARRQAVKKVQATLDQLELKSFANDTPLPDSEQCHQGGQESG